MPRYKDLRDLRKTLERRVRKLNEPEWEQVSDYVWARSLHPPYSENDLRNAIAEAYRLGFESPKKVDVPIEPPISQAWNALTAYRINEYRETLESYSHPCLPFVKWKPTDKGNVEVLNNTINLYRYFDATRQAEFLYECIQETIEKTLPEEVDYLKKYDEMKYFIINYIDMPDRMVDLLIRFLNQHKGKLSGRAQRKEFHSLTADEIKTIENKYTEIFLES